MVRRFPPGLKVPHMGWNRSGTTGRCRSSTGIPAGAHFYFVHSYYPEVSAALQAEGVRAAHCDYGAAASRRWSCAAGCTATQFHPEKSQGWGLRLLANFARLAAAPEAARA